GGKKYDHAAGPDVEEPVRRGPVNLLSVLELVRLIVAVVVELLAHTGDDVDGRLRNPSVETRSGIPGLPLQQSDLLLHSWLRHDDVRTPLAEACARGALGQLQNLGKGIRGNGLAGEVPDHSSFADDLLEFQHRGCGRRPFLAFLRAPFGG